MTSAPVDPQDTTAPPPARGTVLYPNLYCWFILFSALDIMLTHTILGPLGAFGGRELNSIADWVIREAGFSGAIALKLISVTVAIGIIEYVGRRRPDTGRRLARAILILSVLPVAWELVLLAWFAFTDHHAPHP